MDPSLLLWILEFFTNTQPSCSRRSCSWSGGLEGLKALVFLGIYFTPHWRLRRSVSPLSAPWGARGVWPGSRCLPRGAVRPAP